MLTKIFDTVLLEFEESIKCGISCFNILRKSQQLKIFREYGFLDIKLRTVDTLISDYCESRYDFVLDISPNSISFKNKDMEEKYLKSVISIIHNKEYVEDDEFSVLSKELDNETTFAIPNDIFEQLFFIKKIMETRYKVAVLFNDTDYLFTRESGNKTMSLLNEIIRIAVRKQHIICCFAESGYKNNVITSSAKTLRMAKNTEEDYLHLMDVLSIFMPNVNIKGIKHDLASTCYDLQMSHAELLNIFERSKNTGDEISDLFSIASKNIASGSQFPILKPGNITFKDVVGLNDVKMTLENLIIIPTLYPDEHKQYNLSNSGGLLLYGPPGNGKSMIIKALANEINAVIFTISASEIKNKWLGESERLVKELFEEARSYRRSIIMFDEIDGLFSMTETDGSGSGIRGQFLTEVDGMKSNSNVIVIGTTNFPSKLGVDVMRRLSERIYVGLPEHKQRQAVLRKSMKNCPCSPDIDYKKLASNLDGYSSSDIVKLTDKAKRIALREKLFSEKDGLVTHNHLDIAISTTQPTVTGESLQEFWDFDKQLVMEGV